MKMTNNNTNANRKTWRLAGGGRRQDHHRLTAHNMSFFSQHLSQSHHSHHAHGHKHAHAHAHNAQRWMPFQVAPRFLLRSIFVLLCHLFSYAPSLPLRLRSGIASFPLPLVIRVAPICTALSSCQAPMLWRLTHFETPGRQQTNKQSGASRIPSLLWLDQKQKMNETTWASCGHLC
ncbi:hypothetical protein CH063_01247 [Colletotrichum higginsianum]|uniref:Uncharacterized protein n=1 Tax=Colletotrichum higginsianum (strain IMI 349063) TaxID=759273 RepID=H1V4F5_COLHI|nr:hypothetical protein CH063_01247 [Colletotrichum higginsianum]